MKLNISEAWRVTYPGAWVGILAMGGVTNPDRHPLLEQRKGELEAHLRAAYPNCGRDTLRAIPTVQAYERYYRRFKKTYHLLLQLESVVLEGKPIPSVATLVEAMFMAELEDLLLTAGHDLDRVRLPIYLRVANGTETYTRLNGQQQRLKAEEMFIADAQGVISSVIYGPDLRTRLSSVTHHVLFTVYAPVGIDEQKVRQHLTHIEENVNLVSPEARVETLEVYR